MPEKSKKSSDRIIERRELLKRWSGHVGIAIAAVGGLFLVLLMLLPIFGLVGTTSPSDFIAGISDPAVWPALQLSLITTTITLLTVVLCGTPLAWLLARREGVWLRLLESLIHLPMILPPAVAGIVLLVAFGRNGFAAKALFPAGFSLPYGTIAVIVAQIFVAAPHYLLSAISSFRSVDGHLLLVERSLGASPLRVILRVGIPLAAPGLIAGAALCWARALGEFGATLMFAGNMPNKTQTVPLAIYIAQESEDKRAAPALSILLVCFALLLLVLIRRGSAHRPR